MSKTAIKSELESAVQGIEVFGEWQGSLNAVDLAVKQHPTGGLDAGFDRYDNSHLDAQKPLNTALATEKTTRSALKTELAFGTDSSLDLLARLSLLHAIDRFEVKPNHAAPITFRVGRGRVTIANLTLSELEPLGQPGTVTETLRLAELVDAPLRSVSGHLKPKSKNKIEVVEDHAWTELRTLQRPGHRKRFTRRITTRGEVTPSPTGGLILTHPKLNEYGISHMLPTYLEGVQVLSQEQGTSDYDARSSRGSKLDTETTGTKKATRIPLLAVMLAQGLEVERFYKPYSGAKNTGHKMKVTINGHELDIDPLSYIS